MRLVCSLAEMAGVFWLLRSESVKQALRVNAVLALIGPALLVLTWAVGIVGMASESTITLRGLLAVIVGVVLIMMGTAG